MTASPSEGASPRVEVAPGLYDHAFMRVPGAASILDPIILPDHETAVGLIEVAGAGWRVATVSEGAVQHMSAGRALRLAQELEHGEHAGALKPFTAVLRTVAKVAAKANDAARANQRRSA